MRQRCQKPGVTSYQNYGGAGVRVCPRWDSFENFLADMGERPNGTTLGRINDIGDYAPGNCAWQTYKEQAKPGSRNNQAKLSEEQVLCARALYEPGKRNGFSLTNMATDLGVRKGTLGKAISGSSWGHV
jgi:hypothetical protein